MGKDLTTKGTTLALRASAGEDHEGRQGKDLNT